MITNVLARAAAVAALLVAAATARADAVSDWFEFAGAVYDAGHGADAPFDTDEYLSGTRASLAMFEAADSVDRQYASFLKVGPAARRASGPVAVATAAHDVLLAAFPGQKAMIEDRYCLALAEERDGPAKDGGVVAGHAAAQAALKAGGIDPAVSLVPYWPAARPGQWLATTPTVLDPHYAAMRPWFMASATAFRPGPPVALDSPRWLKDLDEVRRIGGKASTERSAADTVLARFWVAADSTPALRAVAAQPGRSLVQNARFYAMLSLASDDMGIAVVEAKLHYGFWRPIAAIRAGGGNAAATADPLWEPLLKTPLHPEYPCGHCINAAVTAAIIDAEGSPKSGLPFTSTKMPGVTVTVPTTADYVRQDSYSRIAGGVHFRSSAEASEAMGRRIAANTLARFAPPL